jgi:hypothetical protein
MIMKTLKYILLGIMTLIILPICNSQVVNNKQVITLQCVLGNASEKLLSESNKILVHRLTAMNLRDFSVKQDNAKSELIVSVSGPIAPATLNDLLLAEGHVSFTAGSGLALTEKDVLESHADLKTPKQPVLNITFRKETWKSLDSATIRNRDQIMRFMIDTTVVASPRIMSEIPHGKIALTGNFTIEEILKMAAIISGGPLPLKFNVVN